MKIIKKNKELKVGDIVRVKSYEDIQKTFNYNGYNKTNGCLFLDCMKQYCLHEFEISNIFKISKTIIRFNLKTTGYWFDRAWLDLK